LKNWYGLGIDEFGRRTRSDASEIEEAGEKAGSWDKDSSLHF